MLVANFLHHFDVPANIAFLRKVHTAMTPGATLAIVEFVPNEDRVSPPIAAAFALQMLGATDAGDVFTAPEPSAMLSAAGFSNTQAKLLEPTPQTLMTATA